MGVMRVLLGAFICLIGAGCVNSEYLFERIENGRSILLPLKLGHVYGVREGDSVSAEIEFTDGHDSAQMSIALRLRPQAEFTSGTYRASVGGNTSAGTVESESLTFLGGQGGSPSLGGLFVFKDTQGRPAYRVQIPLTPISRR